MIGINNYQNLPPLTSATSDADAILNYLVQDLRVPEDQVITLLDGAATRGKIINAFHILEDNTKIHPGDSILIYFAGRGADLITPSCKEAAQQWPAVRMLTIMPCDTKLSTGQIINDISLTTLLSALARKKGNNIVRVTQLGKPDAGKVLTPLRSRLLFWTAACLPTEIAAQQGAEISQLPVCIVIIARMF